MGISADYGSPILPAPSTIRPAIPSLQAGEIDADPFIWNSICCHNDCGVAWRFPQIASAQPAPVPARPAPARPAAPDRRPPAVPGQQPVASGAVAPRAAACHNGMTFDRFLADLKQQAVADGVSQRAMAEAAPYLVYDQSIVNRDRGQRVFGQVFTEFAGRMAHPTDAAESAGANQDACGGVRARRKGIWRAAGRDRRVLGTGEQFRRRTWAICIRCRRWCRWPMTAAARRCFQKETIAALKIIDRGDLTANRDGRLMGRRTRPDAISADALFQLCGGL